VTEQTEPNPEVLQDLPAMQAGVDPQPDIAPVVPENDPDEPAVVGESIVALPVALAPQSESAGLASDAVVAPPVAAAPHSDPVGPGSEAAPLEPVSEAIPPKPAGRTKATSSARSAKAKKGGAGPPSPPTEASDGPKSENMNWYILKVQSNREESIREGMLRRVAIQGLNRYFGEVIVPTEKVTEFKAGKKRVIKRKLYPGYIVVHMEINEDTWFLVRETPGIGDFTGASGVPTPMLPHEVERIIAKQEEKSEKAPDLKIPFAKGDRVKIIEGNFENFEGEVDTIDKTNGRVTVMITIFNRTTPVEFEYWQVESV